MTVNTITSRSCDRCGLLIEDEEFRHEVVMSTFMPGGFLREVAATGERADICHGCWATVGGALEALLTTPGSFVHIPEPVST